MLLTAAVLVPESETLQRQLLLWLRSQLLTLPAFANATSSDSANGTATATTAGPLDIAIGQVKQDIGYFAASCCLQVVLVVALLALAIQVCRWRSRQRRCPRNAQAGKRHNGAAPMSVYAISEAGSDPISESTSCATDVPDSQDPSGDACALEADGAAQGGHRRHLCLVLLMLMLLLLLLAAAAVSVALLIQFWNAGNALQSRMLSEASSNSSTSSSSSSSNSKLTFRSATLNLVTLVNRLIDDSIQSGNATLIDEFQTNFYIIQGFFSAFARNIIDQLFVLLKLKPVLTELEIFITKIETVVSIKAQADALATQLTSADATIEVTRGELRKICPTTGGSSECQKLQADLNKLQVQVSPGLLHMDGLVTVLTFMKQNNINVTQMRGDFVGTYASINASLSTIDAEVLKLLNSVTGAIAMEFGNIKNSSDPTTVSLAQAAASDSIWSPLRDARTYFVAAVVGISLALVPFYVFTVLLSTGLARCLCWLLSSMTMEGRHDELRRLRLDDLSSLGAAPDRIADCPVRAVSAAALRRADASRRKLREYRQRCVCSFRQLSGSSRTYAGGTFAVSLVSVVAFCVPVCVFYATSVAQVRVCKYLRTPDGRATLDTNVDTLLLQQLWPSVTKLLNASIQLPIPFDFRKQPDQLFTRIYNQCDSSNVSLFTAFQLTEVINLTAFVYSPTVLQNLDYGKGMLHDALKGLTPQKVLSTDLQGIGDNAQVKVLGNLIDGELTKADLLGQLDRPLLPIDPVGLADSVDRLVASNPTSSDAVIAAYRSNQLRQYANQTLVPLQRRLSELIAILNASYVGPTAVATITRLAGFINEYRVAFSNPTAVEAESDRVYDATVVVYLPPLVGLLNPMKVRILQRMLPCQGLLRVLQAGSDLACSDVVESTMSVAEALLLSLLAMLLAVCVFLGLLLQVSGFYCVLRGDCCCR